MKTPSTAPRRAAKSHRRTFLKGAAVAGVALGAGAAGRNLAASEPDAPAAPAEQKGYRESAHIREYYRLARL